MKIYEIISTNEELNEGVLSKLFKDPLKSITSPLRNKIRVPKPLVKISGKVDSIIKKFTALTNIYNGFEIYIEPFLTYNNNVEIAEEKYLKTHLWTEDEFETYRRRELGAAVGKLTTAVITFSTAKIPGAIVKKVLKGLFGNIGTLNTIIDGMTAYTAFRALNWMSNEKNASIVAQVLAAPIIGDVSANDVAGSGLSIIIDAFKELIGQQSSTGDTTGIKPQDGSFINTQPGISNQPTKNTPDTTTAQDTQYNPDDWEYYTPSLIKNKKTGEINFKPLN